MQGATVGVAAASGTVSEPGGGALGGTCARQFSGGVVAATVHAATISSARDQRRILGGFPSLIG